MSSGSTSRPRSSKGATNSATSAPASVAERHARPGIVYRGVGDLRPATFAVAWPEDSRSPAVAAFVRAATAVAGAVRAAGDPAPVARAAVSRG